MAYSVNSAKSGDAYYLHRRDVNLRGGRKQTIYYFARDVRDGAMDQLPEGYVVIENKRTGLPMLTKNKK